MNKMAQRVSGFGTTIFSEMTALANKHEAINLGQGFPDFAAPDFLKQAAIEAINADINQYAPTNGRYRLRAALAHKMAQSTGLDFDPDSQITITHGATEAIFVTIMGLVDPGDEVIFFEPFFDSYVPSTIMAGGTPRTYTLRSPDWRIDRDKLAALFNDKTRLIMINTPHNPTGKMFTKEELQMIAELCQQHDVIAVTDEVYEHIVFNDPHSTEGASYSHHTIATCPNMAERTVIISSMGKTFSTTGWKVGWTIASPELSVAIRRAHQFVTFCGAAPLQEAAAIAIETAHSLNYYADLAQDYQQKRDFLTNVLADVGLTPIIPAGTYFVMSDISHLEFANDVEFCRYLTQEIGVAAIPPSAFYANPADGAHLVRFAFCKSNATLEEAAKRLQKLKK